MTLNEIGHCFNRALSYSFSKKKFLMVFSILILCGVFIVFCKALGYEANNWISMSLIFLPIFLSSGVMLALGTLLIRVYYHEIKSLKFSYRKVLLKSWDIIIGTTYLSIPPVLLYLLLWIVLGIFFLLKELPGIGDVMGVILAFAPFLIILASILLVFISLAILFFIAPAIALDEKQKFYLAKKVLERIRQNIFAHLLFFFISIVPIFIIVIFLVYAAHLTGISYIVSKNILSLSVRWFFTMLPFCLFLTPAVIFFFNFAAESYNFLIKKD